MTPSRLCFLLAFLPVLGMRPAAAGGPQRYLPAAGGHRSRVESAMPPAKGRFLVATEQLSDPNFARTVVLLLAYEANGAMGLVINRPTDIPLAAALPEMHDLADRSVRLYLGGPVARESMLLLIRSATAPESSQQIFEDVYASGSLVALRQALGQKGKTDRVRVFAGHAGWGAGQLDAEIARGAWSVVTADTATIFDTAPFETWRKLMDRLSGEWAQGPGRLVGAAADPRS